MATPSPPLADTRAAHLAAFDEIASLLRESVTANVFALEAHQGTPAAATIERQLEHTLDRLALLYGYGTFENLSVSAIFQAAIDMEMLIAKEVAGSAPALAHEHRRAARELLDAARRGVNVSVHESPNVPVHRGVYVESPRQELLARLHAYRDPYLRWKAGIVTILREEEIDSLRSAGDSVDILFLDADELLDLAGRNDQPAAEAEFARRLALARASATRIGDSFERHIQHRLLRQSTTLRNLRNRVAVEHPAAHRALAPILNAHRARLHAATLAIPPSRATLADPLTASIAHEQSLQNLLARATASSTDPARLGNHFRLVANAGTRLAELTRLRP